MSLWVRLPAPTSSALSAAASRLGLVVPPGPRFGVDGTLERFIRVPYTLPDDRLAEAVELLARAWHSVTGSSRLRLTRCGGLAFHQFADVGADRIRKSLKVVAAFQHRHQTASAVLLRRLHQFACRPGEIVGRHAQ